MAKKTAAAGPTEGRVMVFNYKQSEEASSNRFNDVDGVVTAAAIVENDYGGKTEKPDVALKLTIDYGSEKPWEEHYRIGPRSVYKPSPNGKGIIIVNDKVKTMFNDSDCFRLIKTLGEKGCPVEKFEVEDIADVFIGLDCHWIREPKPKKNETDKTYFISLPASINKLPWDEAKGAKGAGGKKVEAGAAVSGDAREDGCVTAVVMCLTMAGGEMALKDLMPKVGEQMPDEWDNTAKTGAIRELVYNQSWLKGHTEWTFDKGVLKLN